MRQYSCMRSQYPSHTKRYNNTCQPCRTQVIVSVRLMISFTVRDLWNDLSCILEKVKFLCVCKERALGLTTRQLQQSSLILLQASLLLQKYITGSKRAFIKAAVSAKGKIPCMSRSSCISENACTMFKQMPGIKLAICAPIISPIVLDDLRSWLTRGGVFPGRSMCTIFTRISRYILK